MNTGRTRFQKGTSGNPGGRPKLPEELKKFGGVTAERTRRLFDKYASMSVGELKDLAKDETLSGLEYNIVLALLDPNKFPFFLDRAVGKVKDVVEQTNINMDYEPSDYEEIPKEALIKLVSGGDK